MKFNFNKLTCPNCDGSGKNRIKFASIPPTNCFLCRGKGTVTLKRLDKERLKLIEKMAKQGKVYLSEYGQPVSVFGHYISPLQKILKIGEKYIQVENWWYEDTWYRDNGWLKGLKVPANRQRTLWSVCPESIEALKEYEK